MWMGFSLPENERRVAKSMMTLYGHVKKLEKRYDRPPAEFEQALRSQKHAGSG